MIESVVERCKTQIHKFKKIYDFESAYWFAEKWLSSVIIETEKSNVGAKQRNYFDGKWINLPSKTCQKNFIYKKSKIMKSTHRCLSRLRK